MELDLIRMAESGLLSKPDGGKVIAWRNVTVDKYNQMARRAIYGNEVIKPWLVEDRVIFTGPARDLENQPIAATDDEGIGAARKRGLASDLRRVQDLERDDQPRRRRGRDRAGAAS